MYILDIYTLINMSRLYYDSRFGGLVLYRNIDQKLMNSLHGLLNCEIGGLDCHVITTEYRTRVHCIYM